MSIFYSIMAIIWLIAMPIQCLLVDRIIEIFYRNVLKTNKESLSKLGIILIASIPGYFGFGGEMGGIMFPVSNLFYFPSILSFVDSDSGINFLKVATFFTKSPDERLFALIHFSVWTISFFFTCILFHRNNRHIKSTLTTTLSFQIILILFFTLNITEVKFVKEKLEYSRKSTQNTIVKEEKQEDKLSYAQKAHNRVIELDNLADQGDPYGLYNRALRHKSNNQPTKAFDCMLSAATKGSPEAAYELWKFYTKGIGVKKMKHKLYTG